MIKHIKNKKDTFEDDKWIKYNILQTRISRSGVPLPKGINLLGGVSKRNLALHSNSVRKKRYDSRDELKSISGYLIGVLQNMSKQNNFFDKKLGEVGTRAGPNIYLYVRLKKLG